MLQMNFSTRHTCEMEPIPGDYLMNLIRESHKYQAIIKAKCSYSTLENLKYETFSMFNVFICSLENHF